MPDRDSFPHRVKLDLSSSIKSWSIAAVRNDFAVFMFSSFLWSSQIVYVSKPSSKWGPSSPGQKLLCVPRRKFANLDLLRIRHFEKFDFRSDTHGTGLIHGKYQTGNRAIWLVDFLYQPSQELSRVINQLINFGKHVANEFRVLMEWYMSHIKAVLEPDVTFSDTTDNFVLKNPYYQ